MQKERKEADTEGLKINILDLLLYNGDGWSSVECHIRPMNNVEKGVSHLTFT